MEKKSFTRTEVYDLAWSEPLLTLSKRYNISNVGLRKICIRLNIPLPKNGHWQKVQYGKKVIKTPLSPTDKEEGITFGIRDENSAEIVKELSPLKVLQKEIKDQLNSKLDALIKALYARKHLIRISQNDIMVIIDVHSIPLSMREKTKKY